MSLEKELSALQRQLAVLREQAGRARGTARTRLVRLERKTRVAVERTVRRVEPRVRRAVAEAAVITRGVRAGIRAGAAAYCSGRPPAKG